MEALTHVFGRRLRAFRKARGMTQEQLGRAAKIDYKHVGGLERGLHQPSFPAVERIAKALGVQYFELFLPDNLASGQLEWAARSLSYELKGNIDARIIRSFFDDLSAAVRRMESQLGK